MLFTVHIDLLFVVVVVVVIFMLSFLILSKVARAGCFTGAAADRSSMATEALRLFTILIDLVFCCCCCCCFMC